MFRPRININSYAFLEERGQHSKHPSSPFVPFKNQLRSVGKKCIERTVSMRKNIFHLWHGALRRTIFPIPSKLQLQTTFPRPRSVATIDCSCCIGGDALFDDMSIIFHSIENPVKSLFLRRIRNLYGYSPTASGAVAVAALQHKAYMMLVHVLQISNSPILPIIVAL